MKALLLNGAASGDAAANRVYVLVTDEFAAKGWTTDSYRLAETDVAPCRGCFGCWTRTPGVCVIRDAGRDIAAKAIASDALVLLTPVTFGGYASALKKALDRIIPLILPFFTKIDGEVHHQPRYERYPAFLGVGLLSSPDPESARIFETLVRRNALNAHSPRSASLVISGDEEAHTVRQRLRNLLLGGER